MPAIRNTPSGKIAAALRHFKSGPLAVYISTDYGFSCGNSSRQSTCPCVRLPDRVLKQAKPARRCDGGSSVGRALFLSR
jgi:hypothetical protein